MSRICTASSNTDCAVAILLVSTFAAATSATIHTERLSNWFQNSTLNIKRTDKLYDATDKGYFAS